MRISTQIVIGLLILSAAANAFTASGAANDMGISPDPGADEQVNRTNETAESFNASQGPTSTLFGAFAAIAGVLEGIFELVFAGPLMLYNLGIPQWLVNIPMAAAVMIVAADVMYVITGRSI